MTWGHGDTQGEGHVTTGAETAVRHLQAKELQGQRSPPELEEPGRDASSRLQREHGPADTSLSVFQPPDGESRDLCCFKRENRAKTRGRAHTSPG